ncbi:MAG TPA: class I SAM-dependent methyltransferase [Tepidisphaeraceae bacterium]|jgi:demethylmenaquinone methyltransferase/2-methoxy-6-polyprenyl-1,4-benzoquinol methylase
MTADFRATSPPRSPALPPHRPLPGYYARGQNKSGFLKDIFDRTACDYERVERVMALGTGRWYRRQALLRAGLNAGMNVLDVAAGTGMVAREAVTIVGNSGRVIGLDPSGGMLAELLGHLSIPVLRGTGERLPFADASFDFLSMGYALRHLSDVSAALREFRRVLRPGGTVCLLEITAPQGKIGRAMLRGYLRGLVPCLTRLAARNADSHRLWQYYWETIDACIPPARVLDAMRDAGFDAAQRHAELGVFSEYTGRRK